MDRGTTGRRGFSIVELMVATVITMIVVAGSTSVVMQVMRSNQIIRSQLDAVVVGRTVLRDISLELAGVELMYLKQEFKGINVPGSYGDGKDNDNDGRVDEERPDGQDNDGGYVDRHVALGGAVERPGHVGFADLGDWGVDEDVVFDRDRLRFQVAPKGDETLRIYEYSIGTDSGDDHVLLRTTYTTESDGRGTSVTEPLAFGVLGLNLLYWNPNMARPNWVEAWDSAEAPFPVPGLEAPASVYLTVAVYSGMAPLDALTLGFGRPVDVEMLSTIVNLEAVISDPRYEATRDPA